MGFPIRHGSFEKTSQWVGRRRWLLGSGAVPSQARWQQLGQGLTQGDPLADAVVTWMHTRGMKPARALFEQALHQGVQSLTTKQRAEAPALLAFFSTVDQLPDWVDADLLRLGGRVIDRCHPVPYYVLRNAGLMAGYLLSDLNKPLLMTGALKGGASRRMAQTMKWYSDCAGEGGLTRQGEGFKSTVQVRLLHAMFRHSLSRHADWDHADMGLPINQTDMVATWLAFSVVFLAGARLMGVSFTREESRAVMHLWRYACWLMGVDAHWLTDDERAGRILLFQIIGSFRGPDESSRLLGQALEREVAQIPYPHARPLRWRLEQAKHLSVTMLFAGPMGMRDLGLPSWVPPWYPLASFGLNLPKSLLLRLAPAALQRRVERKGAKGRRELVQLHFGGDRPDLATFSH